MDIQFDWGILWTVVWLVVILLLAAFVGYVMIGSDKELTRHQQRRLSVLESAKESQLDEDDRAQLAHLRRLRRGHRRCSRFWTGVAFIAGYIVLNIFMFMAIDQENRMDVPATPALAAEYGFGMEHGGTYPLVIGDAVSGTTTDMTARSGLFTHSVDMRSSLDTGFTVDYVHDGSHFPLTIPSSKAEYVTTGVEPGSERITMELEINHQSGYGNVSDNLGVLKQECEPKFVNLLWRCVETDTPPVYKGGAPTLAEVLSGDGIWHVTVYLTSDHYNELFGFNS